MLHLLWYIIKNKTRTIFKVFCNWIIPETKEKITVFVYRYVEYFSATFNKIQVSIRTIFAKTNLDNVFLMLCDEFNHHSNKIKFLYYIRITILFLCSSI